MTLPSSLPSSLAALAKRLRRKDDPHPHPLPNEVALHEVRTAKDRADYVTDPADWCRQVIDHDNEQWHRRTETGQDRSGYLPVYSFSDPDTAFAFKLRWY